MTTIVNGIEVVETTPESAPTWEQQGRNLAETLSVRLTEDELRQFADELVGILEDMGTQLAREDSIKRELKAKMAGLEARRNELASIIRRREQMRSVDVIWERHYGLGLTRKLRLDTGEVLSSRMLRDDERQPPLIPDVQKVADGAAVVHAPSAETEAK